jgi:hypothetical protein
VAAPGQRAAALTPDSRESSDADLAAITASWPDLPAALRAGIVAMVKAATEEVG